MLIPKASGNGKDHPTIGPAVEIGDNGFSGKGDGKSDHRFTGSFQRQPFERAFGVEGASGLGVLSDDLLGIAAEGQHAGNHPQSPDASCDQSRLHASFTEP